MDGVGAKIITIKKYENFKGLQIVSLKKKAERSAVWYVTLLFE